MTTHDIVDVVLEDHSRIGDLLAHMDGTAPELRHDLFQRLVALLARHEAAEGSTLRPALRDNVDNGRPPAESLLEEEGQLERHLADLEKMDAASDEFLGAFRELRGNILDHIQHEERVEHPRLRETLGDEHRRSMAEAFTEIKEHAPTHPHPQTPQSPEVQAAASPVTAMFDWARDRAAQMLSS